jgi:hypothetical protein
MLNRIESTWLPSLRLLRSWGDKVLMVFVIVAAAIAFARFDFRAGGPRQAAENVSPPGSGAIVGAEVLHLWIPEALIDLAAHEDLQILLEQKGQEDLWYAITVRGHQANGDPADITFIRHPYSDPANLQEFLVVLATTKGKPPADSIVDFSTAEIHVLPRELLNRDPRETLKELLSLSQPTEPPGRSNFRDEIRW